MAKAAFNSRKTFLQ